MQMEVKKLQFPQILQEHEINTSKTHHDLLIFLLICFINLSHLSCSSLHKVGNPVQLLE